jgi:hypothetical protein
MAIRVITTIGGVAIVLALLLSSPAAQSAADKTPPVLNTPAAGHFVVGRAVVDAFRGCGDDPGSFVDARESVKWTGSDESGYVRYTLSTKPYAAQKDTTVFSKSTKTRAPAVVATNYDGDCGGGSVQEGVRAWRVVARDAAGNSTARRVAANVSVLQDNWSDLTYGGRWAVSHCECWSGRTTHRTSAAKASVSVSVTGHHVALVMAKGPTRGQARVYVNGVAKATIHSYSASVSSSIVVWNGGLPQGRTNVVKVVNLATSGHPRIDVDAVLTN